MHKDTMLGRYQLIDEIDAFGLMMKVFTEDTVSTLAKFKEKQKQIERKHKL